jgi:anti-sigma regulatory factor (Ser/Thr protein kinase)
MDTETPGFSHSVLFYHSDQEYVDEVVPFVLDGLAMDEPVRVAVPEGKLALLRDALGDTAGEVTLSDITDVGRNPGRVTGVEGAFVAKHAGRRVRLVGELMDAARTTDEYPACVQHEALVNAALAGTGAMGLCPYDARRLDEEVLADARLTHPMVWKGGSTEQCAEYAPDDALVRHNQPLRNSKAAATHTVTELAELGAARSFAARYAYWLGVPSDRVADLRLIVTELATNSLEHTGGACRLALWPRDGHLICQASDSGRLDDPLAGRRPPDADAADGRGLFLVNAVADLVRTHATPTGTTIQAYLRLEPSR